MSSRRRIDDRIRLNLEVSPETRDGLDNVRKLTGSTSITEVLRRAIRLFSILIIHTKQDGSIVLRYKDGREEIIRLL